MAWRRRDSTRTEAGLPLYGHELAGDLNRIRPTPVLAAMPNWWKPFFVGRDAFIAYEQSRSRQVVRFRMDEKGCAARKTAIRCWIGGARWWAR
ncbi:MAG: hypothetical protein M5U34_25840 [Chloroflexi bacterium]|nr:hypothetical protein [Chloroflexota bacterium]